jgi:hypothetical protein
MMQLDECPFMPGMGTINGSGVLKNLNGSSLSLTEIFLREAVQNSFDAIKKKNSTSNDDANTKHEQLIFSLRAYHFTKEQFTALNALLGGANNKFFNENVLPHITNEMLNIEIGDSNTTGLQGNYEPTEKVGNQNFTHFVYYTGNDKEKETTSGGSYGFGKAAFFAYSQARTIVVYTRIESSKCNTDGTKAYQSRFIIVSNNERITKTNSDRCWWGRKTPRSNKDYGTYAAPILGEEADECAVALGMIPFTYDETGTRILVLNAGPDVLPSDEYQNPKTMEQLYREDLPRYIVHWYWNHICLKDISFSLYYENENVPIPDPTAVFPYNRFWDAYKKIITKDANIISVGQERPKVTLGYISVAHSPTRKCTYEDLFPTLLDSFSPIVAYMRGIGHIVYYQKYSIDETNLEETCYGIFCVDTKAHTANGDKGEIDQYFRNIENQTHDQWVHKSDQYHFNYLNTVQQKVKDVINNSCTREITEQKAENISAVIQRVLGEKLMSYSSNIGGATKPLPNTPVQLDTVTTKSSSITPTGKSFVTLQNGIKIICVEYSVHVKNQKKLRINKIIPGIRTLDVQEGLLFDENTISFKEIERKLIDKRTKEETIARYPKLPLVLSENCKLLIKISCNQDCAFDISLDSEEI